MPAPIPSAAEPGMPRSAAPTPRQPRPWLRWLGVALGLAGWIVSLQLLAATGGQPSSPLLDALCGGEGAGDCTAVLTSPHAYYRVRLGNLDVGIPVAALGMAYFAALALWYLFVGPASYRARGWQLAVLLLVLAGALGSANFIRVMAYELHRWCGGCLVAHGINFALLLTTLLGWPWRPGRHTHAHPTARLALASLSLGLCVVLVHLQFVLLNIANSRLKQSSARFEEVLSDPEFIVWDHQRQTAADIPLAPDEIFGGNPDAPHTLVVFGDFQCLACRQSHDMLMQVAARYPDQLRVAFRHFPQDPACNPNPRFVAAGHFSACLAARAAEAAALVGGRDAYLSLRKLLWERQGQLPHSPGAAESARAAHLLADWAVEVGLDRAAFLAALDEPATTARIERDLDLARKLDIQAVPVLYLDGRRLRNWSKLETWDTLLGAPADTQPATAPAAR